MAEKTKKQINDAIMLLMYSDDPKERKDAAAFLVGVIDRAIVPQIVQAAKHEKDSSVKYFLNKEISLLKGNYGDLDLIISEIKNGGGGDDILKSFAPKKAAETKINDEPAGAELEETTEADSQPQSVEEFNDGSAPDPNSINSLSNNLNDDQPGRMTEKQEQLPDAGDSYNSLDQEALKKNNGIILDDDILNALDDFQREIKQENEYGGQTDHDKKTSDTSEVDDEILKILASEGLSNLVPAASPEMPEVTHETTELKNQTQTNSDDNKDNELTSGLAIKKTKNDDEAEIKTENINETDLDYLDKYASKVINSNERNINSEKNGAADQAFKIEESKAEFIISELEKMPFDKSIKMDPMTLVEISKITEMIRRNKTDFLPELVEKLNTDDNPYVIAAIISAIGILGNKTHAGLIIPFLNNRDTRVIANSIEALEKLGDSTYLEYMFKGVLHPDSRVKTNAIKAIWKFTQKNGNSDQAIIQKLEKMAMSERGEIYNPALYVLGEIGSDSAISALERIALNAERAISIKALETIQKIKDTKLEIPLEFLNDSENVPDNKDSSEPLNKTSNIIQNQDTSQTKPELLNEIEEIFNSSPDDIDEATRKEITTLQEMSKLKSEDCLNELIKKLPKAANKYTRATIISVIGSLGFPGSMETLLPYLDDNDDRVVANTVEALGKIENSLCVNHIIKLIIHPDNRVKANVIKVLWKYTQSNKLAAGMIINRLREMLNSFKPDMRESAIYVLSEIATPEAIALIEYALNDKFSVIRMKAQQMLEKARLTARKRNMQK